MLRQYDFVPAPVFYAAWEQIRDGLFERQNAAQFLRLVGNFNSLLGTYDSYAIRPVFSRAPAQLQEYLTPQLRQQLAMCRDKLTRFLDDYEAFLSRAHLQMATEPFPKMVFARIPPL